MSNHRLAQDILVSFLVGVLTAGLIRYLVHDLFDSRFFMNSLAAAGGLICAYFVRTTLIKKDR